MSELTLTAWGATDQEASVMRRIHKLTHLHVVPDCPQPEPREYRPIQYGAAPWPSRLPSTPTADEITLRARAQSLLSKGGHRAELPDIETARRVIAEHESAAAAVPGATLARPGVGSVAPASVAAAGNNTHKAGETPAEASSDE